MAQREGPELAKPPVALGCFFAVSVVVAIFGLAAFAIVFLESGADTGKIELDAADSYRAGTAEFVSEHNIYLVRLPDGSFVALADMDAANRASTGSRCRVGVAPLAEADSPLSTEQLRSRMSAEAAGSSVVLRETCFGAVYDIAGVRLTGDGRNLDRFDVGIDSGGRVVADRSERSCSVREGATWASPVDC